MLTKSDFEQLEKRFITKDDLRHELKKFATKDELKDSVKELRNDIVQFKDDILHELIKIREDFAILTGYRDKIENHEERLEKLESKVL